MEPKILETGGEYFPGYLIYPNGDIIGRLNKLKHQKFRLGYVYVTLSNKGRSKKFLLHRLLGINFIPNPLNKPTINHKNGIKDDNRLENLEWATRSENTTHAQKILKVKHIMPPHLKRGLNPQRSSVYMLNPKTKEIIRSFECIMDAAEYVNRNEANIRQAIKNEYMCANYRWKYKKKRKIYKP